MIDYLLILIGLALAGGCLIYFRSRQKMENLLAQSEAEFRGLSDLALTGVMRVDLSGRILYANQAVAQTFGVDTPDDLINYSVEPFISDPAQYRAFPELLRTSPGLRNQEMDIRTRQGEIRHILYSGYISNDVMRITLVDISERMRSEQEIRQLSSVVSQMADPVVITSVDGVIEYVNPAFEQLAGYSLAEAVGQTPSLLKSGLMTADFYKTLWDTILGGAVFEGEFINRKKSGEIYYEIKTITPIRDTKGDITHFVATGKDNTERKQGIEMQLKSQASLEMAQKVAQLGSWEIDIPNGQVALSVEAFRLFGRDPARGAPTLKEVWEMINPGDHQLLRDAQQLAVDLGEPISCVFRMPMPDKSLRYIEARIRAGMDVWGNLQNISGTAMDITKRREMEEEIRERVKELTCLFKVGHLLENQALSNEVVCQQIVTLLSPAMQFADQAVSMIELDGNRYCTAGDIVDFSHGLSAPILVQGETRGRLSVFYVPDAPYILPEEQALVDNLSRMFGLWLERRQSQKALSESDERFRQLAGSIQEVFWIFDMVDHRFVYLSPAYETIWGSSVQSVYENPDEYLNHILPEDLPVLVAAKTRQSRGESTDIEYRIRRPDGSLRWVWDRGFPIFDQQGVLVRTAGATTDITDLKTVQQAMQDLNRDLEQRVEERTEEVRQKETVYRALFENSNDGILILSPEGVELRANQQALDLLGYNREEWLTINHGLLLDLAQRLGADRHFNAVLRGEVVPLFETRFPRKDGSQVDVEINFSAVRDAGGKIMLVQCVVRNITERIRAQEALRASSELFTKFMRHSPIYAFVKDVTPSQSLVLYASDNFNEMIGVPGSQMVGKTMHELFPPEFAEKITADDWNVVSSGEKVTLDEDLNNRNYTSIKFPILQGERTLLAGYTIDITDRKKAEDGLRESRDQLSAANAALEKASRMKDEFLASMSHELRTPLTGILGLSEALQLQVHGDLNEKQLKVLSNIEKSGRHLLSLINDILDLSKIEAGMLEIQLDACSVDDVCQSSLQLVKGMAHQKDHYISCSVNMNGITVRADARRLKQMIVNLLSNAIKFTPNGKQIGLEVEAIPDQQVIRFSVWDQGVGIRSEGFEKLFQPFVQLDSSLSRQYAGTGLGLSLVQRLAELHGGGVEVESVYGQGSRFTIILPWSLDRSNPVLDRGEEDFISLKNALAIENKNGAVETAAGYLKALGFVNILLPNIHEAFEQAAAMKPCAILLDRSQSEQCGLELLSRLKADERTRGIPVMVIAREALREAALSGADGCLVRPFTQDDLRAALEKAAARTPDRPVMLVGKDAALPLVMAVDDNELVLETLSDFLAFAGYRVATARSGFEMLDRVVLLNPAVILVDIQMPDMDGLEAMRRLRANRNLTAAATPVIAITALAMSGDRERCMQAGANEYMSKPILLKELAKKINQLLAESV